MRRQGGGAAPRHVPPRRRRAAATGRTASEQRNPRVMQPQMRAAVWFRLAFALLRGLKGFQEASFVYLLGLFARDATIGDYEGTTQGPNLANVSMYSR